MYVISLYLVLHVCAAIFDVMCVKKTEATKRGISDIFMYDEMHIVVVFVSSSPRW
jgi:hypothetical protein